MDPKDIKPTVRYRVQLPSQRMQLNGMGLDPVEQILDVMASVNTVPDADELIKRIQNASKS